MFQVCEKRCNQCLFSKDRIVDKERMAEIIKTCHEDGSYFICHKSSIHGNGKVCCRGFYDTQDTQIIRVAQRLGVVEFVDPKEAA